MNVASRSSRRPRRRGQGVGHTAVRRDLPDDGAIREAFFSTRDLRSEPTRATACAPSRPIAERSRAADSATSSGEANLRGVSEVARELAGGCARACGWAKKSRWAIGKQPLLGAPTPSGSASAATTALRGAANPSGRSAPPIDAPRGGPVRARTPIASSGGHPARVGQRTLHEGNRFGPRTDADRLAQQPARLVHSRSRPRARPTNRPEARRGNGHGVPQRDQASQRVPEHERRPVEHFVERMDQRPDDVLDSRWRRAARRSSRAPADRALMIPLRVVPQPREHRREVGATRAQPVQQHDRGQRVRVPEHRARAFARRRSRRDG